MFSLGPRLNIVCKPCGTDCSQPIPLQQVWGTKPHVVFTASVP